MEKKIYEGEVDSAVVSTYDGQTGFLCNHAPYLAELGIGEVKVKDGGKTEYFALPLVGENGQRSVDYESFQDPFNILGFEHGKLMSINQDLFNRYRIIAVLDRGKFIEANPGVSLEDVAKAGPKSFPPVEKVERIPH